MMNTPQLVAQFLGVAIPGLARRLPSRLPSRSGGSRGGALIPRGKPRGHSLLSDWIEKIPSASDHQLWSIVHGRLSFSNPENPVFFFSLLNMNNDASGAGKRG
jgi:hypothetical protein